MSGPDDEAQLRPVDEWSLPTEVTAFLAWLREALAEEPSDRARWATFKTFSAAADMPAELRKTVDATLGS